MILTKLYKEFFRSEKTGGLILVFATMVSLVLANSPFSSSYLAFWDIQFHNHTITHWINDGLMTIFFLLIGLELKREIYEGELSSIKKSSLPVFAAFGGMLIPASIFLMMNIGTSYASGAGIPMATDIAFAIGILSLLGKRVPASLKIFLTALAVIDDLGAIIVIAIFYTKGISILNLAIAFSIYAGLILMNRMKINRIIPYMIGGIAMWFFMLNSGVHATITGVFLAFAIPYATPVNKTKEHSLSAQLQHVLHVPVAFFILPLFALANTGIEIKTGWEGDILQFGSLGIILGLFVGKPLGITLFSYLGVKLKLANLPSDLKWSNIVGVGFLGGVGFTMSIFIALLAYTEIKMTNSAKISILIGSFISAVVGYFFLSRVLKNKEVEN